MTAPYRRVGGQLTDYLLEGMSHGCIIATFEIGSANTHLEQGVTGEGHLLFLAVEGNAARCVSRGGNDLEMV